MDTKSQETADTQIADKTKGRVLFINLCRPSLDVVFVPPGSHFLDGLDIDILLSDIYHHSIANQTKEKFYVKREHIPVKFYTTYVAYIPTKPEFKISKLDFKPHVHLLPKSFWQLLTPTPHVGVQINYLQRLWRKLSEVISMLEKDHDMDPEETFHSYRQKEPRGFSIRSAGAPKNLPVKYDASQDPWVRDRDSSMEESSNSSGSLHLSPIQSPPRADLPELPLSSFDLTQVASNSSSSNSNSNSNNEMTDVPLDVMSRLVKSHFMEFATMIRSGKPEPAVKQKGMKRSKDEKKEEEESGPDRKQQKVKKDKTEIHYTAPANSVALACTIMPLHMCPAHLYSESAVPVNPGYFTPSILNSNLLLVRPHMDELAILTAQKGLAPFYLAAVTELTYYNKKDDEFAVNEVQIRWAQRQPSSAAWAMTKDTAVYQLTQYTVYGVVNRFPVTKQENDIVAEACRKAEKERADAEMNGFQHC